jgi:hypothetical protein
MFVRLANDIPFVLDDDTDRLPATLPNSKGYYTSWDYWLIKALRTGKNILSISDHGTITFQSHRWNGVIPIRSVLNMTCRMCISADRRNRFTLLDIDDVYKSIGPDWTARLIIQHGDESDLTGETIVKMFSRDQNLLTLIASTKSDIFERSWFAYGRGWSTYDQIPNIVGSRSSTHGNMRSRFYPVWDRSCFYETSTRITFIFFCNFCPNHFRRYGWSYDFHAWTLNFEGLLTQTSSVYLHSFHFYLY